MNSDRPPQARPATAPEWRICEGPGEAGLATIIVPTYNRAYTLTATIESVLAQTYRPIEVIVVDDGSTDDTREVAAGFGDAIRYVYQSNAGVAAARNHGFSMARGEFIALIDSDDRWMPWKLELQIALLRRRPDVGMVWTDMAAVSPEGDRLSDRYLRSFYKAYREVRIEDIMTRLGTAGELDVALPPEFASCATWVGDIFSPMLRGTLVHTPTTVLRRQRVRETGGYDESLRPVGEDFDFHLGTAARGPVAFIDVPAIEYRFGAADQLTSGNALAFAVHYLHTFEKWLARERDRVTLSSSEIRSIRGFAYEFLGSQELMTGDRRAARSHLWQSMKQDPFRPMAPVLLALAIMPPQVLQAVRQMSRRRREAAAQKRTAAA